MAINLNIISKFDDSGIKKIKGELGGLGKAFAGLAGIAAGAIASIGIAQFARDTVNAASDLEESLNAVNVAFGESADAVLAIGENAAKSLGVSRTEFNQAAVRFSAFAERVVGEGGNVAGFIGDISQRATDFASVFNIDVAEALQVFQSGLSGEAEPLKRFGINLLDSEVRAYAYANGIGTIGKELTETEKVQARYGLLMQSTNKVAGDFANTSDGLANSQRILQGTFTDLQAEVGAGLTPAIAGLVAAMVPLAEHVFPMIADFVNDTLAPVLDRASQNIRRLIGQFTSGYLDLDGVLDRIRASFTSFFENQLPGVFERAVEIRNTITRAILEAIPGIVDGLVAGLPLVLAFITDTLIPQLVANFTFLVTSLASVFAQIMPVLIQGVTDIVPDLVQSVADILPPIIRVLLAMVPVLLTTAIKLFEELVSAVVEITPQLIQTIIDLLPQIVQTITSMLPGVLDAAVELFHAIVAALPVVLPVLITAVLDLLPEIIDALIDMIGPLTQAAVDLFFALIEAIPIILPVLLPAVAAIIPQIVTTLLNGIPQIVNAGVELLKGLAKGIRDNISRILGDAIRAVTDFIVDGTKNLLGIRSPSRVFAEIGKDVVAGFNEGIKDGEGLIAQASVGVAQTLTVSANEALMGQTLQPLPIASMASGRGSAQNIYQVTVNAGMGADGRNIGQLIVDEIKKFERISGKVFVAA